MSTPAPESVGDLIADMSKIQPVKEPRAILTQSMSFQIPGEDGATYSFPGNMMKFATKERPYDRTRTINPGEPVILTFDYLGDLSNVGLVYFHNMTGGRYEVNPTDEQRAADQRAVVLIKELNLLLPPRFAMPVIPVDSVKQLTLVALETPARVRWIGVGS